MYSLLVANLDEQQREKFDTDLYTPPEFRQVLKRVNAMMG